MIRCIIVEDEEFSRTTLQDSLRENFPNVEVIASCETGEEGMKTITELHPDLVFLDVELTRSTSFDMLNRLKRIDFEIIFTTAYDKYALQAIKFSAVDYLLKPFSVPELGEALKRFREKKKSNLSTRQYDILFHNLKNIDGSHKIALPTMTGLDFVAVSDIVRCESEANYTTFYLISKNKLVVSRTLKEYEEMLEQYGFFRVHNQHLINLSHIRKYIRGDGGIVTMTDGSQVDVSRRKKDEFLRKFENA